MVDAGNYRKAPYLLSKLMVTKCETPLFQKSSEVQQPALFFQNGRFRSTSATFFHGDSAKGSLPET